MEPARWRVPAVVPGLKLAGAAALVVLAVLLADGDPVRPALGALVAAGLAGWAGRDLLAPVRLAVDADGIRVPRGYAGQRRLEWARIERIRVDSRSRRGLRSETLEIDAGDSLHLFGRYDLGAEPAEVAEALRAAWQAGARGGRQPSS
ncbi:PH domain-containing protein [Plantactinospora sp. GCM10030261]|uniref:PH domain-containing protein n=1 Tax=Plantactinospora sp. GCM10030261 TaxID=3273420 RepID=UPI003623E3AD